MLFSSMLFVWVFLPIVVIGNFLLKKEYRNFFLLIASLIFYAWGEPKYVLLMLLSIFLNWTFGLLIEKSQKHKKAVLVLCIALNLALLGYFKYYNFLANNVNAIFSGQVLPVKNIALPIGISFFTFQAMSYVIDLYRKECKLQKNLFNLALYISFFPQLIAGPIVRYSDIDRQLQERTVDVEKFSLGVRRFVYGLGKKVIISNCLAQAADAVFDLQLSSISFATAWIGALCYTFQIYYDFSGYSDMAIGLGWIFGFDFLENFNYPYLSKSIQEFWQRWHISLGTWFREYVYIPLGGNRKGKARTYINLIIVFFLTGMWHGASWNFIVWGLYQGFFQIIERLGFKKFLSKHKIFSHVYCVVVFVFGWVIFRAENLTDAMQYILRMLTPWQSVGQAMFISAGIMAPRTWVTLGVAILGCGLIKVVCDKFKQISNKWKNSIPEIVFLAVVAVYCILLLASNAYNPFIYFRF